MASFNLVDEPWIPVDSSEGVREVSLAEAFSTSRSLGDITHDSPLVVFGVYRLLLAIAHRAINGPGSAAEWSKLWDAGGIPNDVVADYLTQWRGRFDLFDGAHPFMQVAGLHTVNAQGVEKSPLPITALRIDAACKNNTTLFDHRSDSEPEPMHAAEAARWLVADQAFALGGGKGISTNLFGNHPYRTDAPCARGWCVLLARPTLAETLLANMAVYTQSNPVPRHGQDLPAWERDEHRTPGAVTLDGYVDYLTLPARYVRLLPDTHGNVTEMFYGSGLGFDTAAVRNPFAFYRVHKKLGPLPIRPSAVRTLWRDSGALLAMQSGEKDLRPTALRQAERRRQHLGADAKMSVRCFGLGSDKAKVFLWREERFDATPELLSDPTHAAQLTDGLQLIEKVGQALYVAIREAMSFCRRPEGGDHEGNKTPQVKRRLEYATASYWTEAQDVFQQLLVDVNGGKHHPEADTLEAAIRIARESYTLAMHTLVGSTSRRVKAEALGARILNRTLYGLRRKMEGAPE